MSVFRILCLAGGILKEWEELQAENVVEALKRPDARSWVRAGRGLVRRPTGRGSAPCRLEHVCKLSVEIEID